MLARNVLQYYQKTVNQKENSMTVISLQEYKDNKAKSNMAKTFKSASDMDARIERIKNSISRINSLMAQLREERKES
jgi:glycosylphosphatidylinositol transamidase (GPIT) subunit GPI8